MELPELLRVGKPRGQAVGACLAQIGCKREPQEGTAAKAHGSNVSPFVVLGLISFDAAAVAAQSYDYRHWFSLALNRCAECCPTGRW